MAQPHLSSALGHGHKVIVRHAHRQHPHVHALPRVFALAVEHRAHFSKQRTNRLHVRHVDLNIAGAQVKATEDETEKMIKDIIDQLYQEGEFEE